MNGLPAGWRLSVDGPRVVFEVPASAVDGLFELSDAEALAAGERLIELSERAALVRRRREAGLEDAPREQRPGFIEQLESDAKEPSRALPFSDWRDPSHEVRAGDEDALASSPPETDLPEVADAGDEFENVDSEERSQ